MMDRRLLRLARPGLPALALAVVLGVAGAIATLVQWSTFARLVADAFLGGRTVADLRGPFGLFVAAVAVRAALGWGREVAAARGAALATGAIRSRLTAQLAALGPARLREEQMGALVAAATTGIDRLDGYFARFVPQTILSQIVPLIIAIAIWPRDWMSAVLLLATAPVLPILMILVGSYSADRINAQWIALTRLKAAYLDAIEGLATIRALGQGAAGRERVARQSEAFRERTMGALRYAFLSGFVLEFITSVAIALVAVTLGVRLLSGGLAFEAAFLILLLAPEFFRPLRDLGAEHHAGMEGQAAAEPLIALLARHIPKGRQDGVELEESASGAPLGSGLMVSGLTFRFPGVERVALDGVDLIVRMGERVALVGPSGAGKSTLLDLILGFHSPERGRIINADQALGAVSAEAWREQIAFVPQQPHLFATSALDNIRLARPDASLGEVRRAAALAGADEFIGALPQGYDTPLGEGGARLSRGQAQRIAIARAFLKDAPLLILDEPTAHLDPESEATVTAALERLVAGRAILLVAHRLATVAAADRIVVLDDGRIVESGTHAQLLARGGRYAELAQSARPEAAELLVPERELLHV